MNCELSLTTLDPPDGQLNFNLFYLKEDLKVNGIRYENTYIKSFYTRFKTNLSYCPIVEWELYYNDSVTLLAPDD